MKLEMATFNVNNVRFGERTRYQGGALEVNKDELIQLVLEDKRIVSAAVEIVYPGEKTRVVKVRDEVEPRVKVSRLCFQVLTR
jgi:glycine reductase